MSDTGNCLTQLVVFRLQAREYALPVEQIVEVLRMVAITPVPESPTWLPGVINLRGRLIPIVDLRTRLGLPSQAPGLNTPIIIVETAGRLLGLIVDAVIDLLRLPRECVERPGTLASPTQVVSAIARAGDRIVMILDLPILCAGSEQLLIPDADSLDKESPQRR